MSKLFSVWQLFIARPFLLFVLAAPAAFCQEKTATSRTTDFQANALAVGVDIAKLGNATAALQAFVDDQKIAGAVMMVSRRGKIVLADAVGLGRVEPMQSMQLDSIFRIYSMTKAITSVAAMQLVEQGKLELDDPVSKHLPEFATLQVASDTQSAGPTVRDLLRHTSGFTYGIFGDTSIDRKYRSSGILSRNDSNQVLVEKLSKIPLQHKPATKFLYSVSSDVLGRLVEVVSGNSLEVQFSKNVFVPLGMKDTGFYVPAEKASRFVDNFGPKETGGLKTVELASSSPYLGKPAFQSGGGGLVSTAGDYMRFCNMLCGLGEFDGVRLLTAKTVGEMSRNQLPPLAYPIAMNGLARQGVGFGLGFSVVVEPISGFEYVPQGEYGWGGAASTHFWISPQHELAVVVLSQMMPFTFQCESAVKPLIYEAIK